MDRIFCHVCKREVNSNGITHKFLYFCCKNCYYTYLETIDNEN